MDPSTQILLQMSRIPNYHQWVIDQFIKLVHGKTLEAGCGIGTYISLLSSCSSELVGVDANSKYIKNLRTKFPKVRFEVSDLSKKETIPFSRNSFDTIVCINVLEHIQNDSEVLKNLYNLLKPGGSLILLVPAHPTAYGSLDKVLGHKRRYTSTTLRNLLELSRFTVRSIKYFNFPGLVGWYAQSCILKKTNFSSIILSIFDFLVPAFSRFEKYFPTRIGLSLISISTK